jgi:hypothetical protein
MHLDDGVTSLRSALVTCYEGGGGGVPTGLYGAPTGAGSMPPSYTAPTGATGAGAPAYVNGASYGGFGGSYGGFGGLGPCQTIVDQLAGAVAQSCAAQEYLHDLVKLGKHMASERADVMERCGNGGYDHDGDRDHGRGGRKLEAKRSHHNRHRERRAARLPPYARLVHC